MRKFIDMTGRKFTRLTVFHQIKSKDKSSSWWLCKCDCGKLVETSGNKLRTLHTKSCGCLRRDNKVNLIHGHKRKIGGSKTYTTWRMMKNRCLNKKAHNYKYYGGSGIAVCEEWLEDFQNFLNDMGERPTGRTLDRINPFGNYEPENCRWSTQKEQMNNLRKNTKVLSPSQKFSTPLSLTSP